MDKHKRLPVAKRPLGVSIMIAGGLKGYSGYSKARKTRHTTHACLLSVCMAVLSTAAKRCLQET